MRILNLWILLLAGNGYADAYVRQPAIDVVRYEISLELLDESDSISAAARIHVRMRENAVSGLKLDFAGMQTDSVRVHGHRRPFVHRNGNLSFDFNRKYNRNEIAIIEVRYHGKPERGFQAGKNKYGRRVFFSENWPDRARNWIPCIDHPSDKAGVHVTVTAPRKYSVVSNGRLVSARVLQNGRKRTRWSEDKAIPTYCIALGVAEYTILRQKDAGNVPIEWYSYPEDVEAAARKFRSTAAAVEYFSWLIAPYPYEKLAQVQASVSFGGMENSSAIFYKESSIQDAPNLEAPVPHEIAHQWFGDSVTQSDWDHLWLSEGFATYMEALFEEHRHGAAAIRQIMADHTRQLDADPSARQIPLIDPTGIALIEKLNTINYEKGAWLLHMLRGMLGDPGFFGGLRRFYRMHEGGNATSDDFRVALESVGGISLSVFFKQWLYQPGWPEYKISWKWDEVTCEVELSVHQMQAGGNFDMPLEVVFVGERSRDVRTIRISERMHTFRIPLQAKPLSIEADPELRVLKALTITQK